MPYTAPHQGSGAQLALGQGAGTAVRRAIETGMYQRENPEETLLTSIMRSYGMKVGPGADALAKEAGLDAAAAGGGTGGAMSVLKSL
jgi:hypothetical protein